jgi:hypothetical protein
MQIILAEALTARTAPADRMWRRLPASSRMTPEMAEFSAPDRSKVLQASSL